MTENTPKASANIHRHARMPKTGGRLHKRRKKINMVYQIKLSGYAHLRIKHVVESYNYFRLGFIKGNLCKGNETFMLPLKVFFKVSLG